MPDAFVETLRRSRAADRFLHRGLVAAGCVIACTGSKGCKYAAADTKAHALALFKPTSRRAASPSGSPVNLHLTGCPHSPARSTTAATSAVVGTKLADGREGYHVVLGGGMDHEQGIAREIFRGVRATEVNALVEKVLVTYEAKKENRRDLRRLVAPPLREGAAGISQLNR